MLKPLFRVILGGWLLVALLFVSYVEAEERVVSLAPSLTEIVFAIEAESQLVGVTNYCDFPPEAQKLPRVGGFADLSLERILTLKPTLVIGLREHEELLGKIAALGVNTSLFFHESLPTIFKSIEKLGVQLERPEEGLALLNSMRQRIEEVARRAGENRRVLLTVGGHIKRGSLDAIYAAGSLTIYDELISLAGGTNVFASKLRYGKLSAEAILALDPDVIVDLVPASPGVDRKKLKADVLSAWHSLSRLRAVQADRVFIIDEEFVVNPGPRIIDTLELIQAAIYAESATK